MPQLLVSVSRINWNLEWLRFIHQNVHVCVISQETHLNAETVDVSYFVFVHCALYLVRLKQWGYSFILCLHQIPFTFKMLLFFFAWKTKSQRLCPDKAYVIQRDEHNKRRAGQRCYSEDRYRWPADYDNNVQDGALEFFPEGTVGMWRTNKLINDIDEIGFSCVTMLQMRKAPVCLCVLQTNKEFVHFLNVCPCLYLQNQLSTAVNLHISACVHLFESLKGVSPSSNQDSIIFS